MSREINQDLLAYMEDLEIIDTHEHLPISNKKRNRDTDFFIEYCNSGYLNRSLLVAGMEFQNFLKLLDRSRSIPERWDLMEPYWEKCRFSGYGQVFEEAVRILYGIPGINRETVEEVDRCIRESLDRDHYEEVLKKVCHVRTALIDTCAEHPLETQLPFRADARYFSPVIRIDPYIRFENYGQFMGIEERYGSEIRRLEHLRDALEDYIYKAAARGATVFKTALAYERTILFEEVEFADAEKDFNRMFSGEFKLQPERRPCRTGEALENYLMHHALKVIEGLDIPLQVHTGLQEGVGNDLSHSNPLLLNKLFLDYPKLKFDIFHIGYPYEHVLGGLAKMFPNVYINMCWAHILSPEACKAALEEWLELIPYNKILGFGGDHCVPDAIVGHRTMALRNIAEVLTRKIQDGLFDRRRAERVAEALLCENAAELYKTH